MECREERASRVNFGLQELAVRLRSNIARVIVDKEAVIDLLLVALLSDGHVLLEDVPGVGKTLLAKALARSLNLSFQRIQGTPDLLPGDLTGISYFDQRSSRFVFRPGPLFSHVVLVDEINRATPRAQAALLEAMAERQITIERETRPLPRPYLVLATQNPVELEGTFPLPEAQLDRFLMRLPLGYPSEEAELALLQRFREAEPLEELEPVADAEAILRAQREIRRLYWQPEVERYLLTLVRATRNHPAISLGVSPRGTLALQRASAAYAAIHGRDYVLPDDIKRLAPVVLAHRLMLTTRGRLRHQDAEQVLQEILENTAVPVETPDLTALSRRSARSERP
ncbi:AAA family ATPase [Thermogemmatispora tikiterensis]|uniref:AAA family ATPase n=1 Tax=Thermogemmatispora tikiterensis TaxID=1825093 RepID=A0A328VRT1_9CHLR|nr:MoxR family ATPase [Thermogemmatispora tikiterensis]RAQ98440.1 AAA family ATPase [Thermogemmatispora tikiterensis]